MTSPQRDHAALRRMRYVHIFIEVCNALRSALFKALKSSNTLKTLASSMPSMSMRRCALKTKPMAVLESTKTIVMSITPLSDNA
jgi:hypothetical protein